MHNLSTAFDMVTYDDYYFFRQQPGCSSAFRNYGFIYDYDQTNVAHGANPGLIGRRLEDIISGVSRFDGVVNGTELHQSFVDAAEAGGKWVTYNWINAGDAEPYLKLAYLVKVFRGGRNYYLGVGLSDMPLITRDLEGRSRSDLPCSSSFSGPCVEEWMLSIVGFR
eukprot:4315432-Prymnesium_polylepis.1